MPSMTREQYNKWSSVLPEGWKFDAQHYIMWGEKEIVTDSPENENGEFYRATLEYKAETENAGYFRRETGKQIPTITIHRYTEKTGNMYSVVMIFSQPVGEIQSKKNYNVLVKLAGTIDINDYFRLAAEKDTGKAYNDMSDFSQDSSDAETTEPEETPETAEEPENATEAEPEEATPEESEHDELSEEPEPEEIETKTAEPEQDNFSALAMAYFTGKTAAVKKPERKPDPEPAAEPEPEPDPEPVLPGYHENQNDLLPDSVRASLSALVPVGQPDRYGRKNIFFSVPYSETVKLVYYVNTWNKDRTNVIPAQDATYFGFLIDENLYTASKSIDQKFSHDINDYLVKHIPSEEAAAHVAANVDEYDRDRINRAKAATYYPREAKNLFFDGEKPTLYLYNNDAHTSDEIIEYIQEPEKTIENAALRYMCEKPALIYERWIEFTQISAEYEKILSDKNREEHKILKISKSIWDEKSVKIELANGKKIKVEADAVKRMPYSGYISSYSVAACDRQYLPQNSYGRPDDIHASDIVSIRHGARTLYTA